VEGWYCRNHFSVYCGFQNNPEPFFGLPPFLKIPGGDQKGEPERRWLVSRGIPPLLRLSLISITSIVLRLRPILTFVIVRTIHIMSNCEFQALSWLPVIASPARSQDTKKRTPLLRKRACVTRFYQITGRI